MALPNEPYTNRLELTMITRNVPPDQYQDPIFFMLLDATHSMLLLAEGDRSKLNNLDFTYLETLEHYIDFMELRGDWYTVDPEFGELVTDYREEPKVNHQLLLEEIECMMAEHRLAERARLK